MNIEKSSFNSRTIRHHGRNVKRFREMLGIKQESFADQLNMSQQTISRLESREEIEDELLDRIAKILNVPVDAIKNLSDENAVNIISNTFQDESAANVNSTNHFRCNFNPLDKVIELYERIVKEKEEQIIALEQRLKEKK